jgi:hypothetical protein
VLFSFAWNDCLVLCVLDLRLYIFVVLSMFVCAWSAVYRFVWGVSLLVFSVLFVCSAWVVECVVDGGGFMIWASCRLCCVFFRFVIFCSRFWCISSVPPSLCRLL